ncbi:MAG: ATP-binding protein [Pirellula sp.]|jgi:uncharacterized protein YhaN
MKVRDIQIDGFGVWSGLSVDSLPEGMTVFYGPNEAGKTTLMQFLRTMLYGFTAERRQRYLPPVFGGKPGGAMRVTGPGGGYEIARRATLNDPSIIGQLTVTSSDGVTQGQHRLTTLLGSVDESIFTNVFAIGLRELQELSTLDDTAAADELYKLSSGLDRVSLVDVMRQLRGARGELISTDAQTGQISSMMMRREKLREEIEQQTIRGRRWGELATHRRNQQTEIDELKQRIGQWQLEAKTVETSLQVREPWLARQTTRNKIKALNARTDIPDDSISKLRDIQEQIEDKKRQILSMREERKNLRLQAKRMPLSKGILALGAKIEAANEQGPWISGLQMQIQRLQSELQQAKEQLVEDAKRLGLSEQDQQALFEDKRLANLPDLSRQAISQLAGPARDVRVFQTRLKQAKEQGIADKKEADRLASELDGFLAIRGHGDLQTAHRSSNEMLATLRKVQMLDERIEKLRRHRKEIEEQAVEVETDEVFPVDDWWRLLISYAPGFLCTVFGISNFFGWSLTGPKDPIVGPDGQVVPPSSINQQTVGFLLILVGVMLLGFTYYRWKSMEQDSQDELESCDAKLEAADLQLQKTVKERNELLAALPDYAGTLEQRIRDAEGELTHCESHLPVFHNLQAAQQRYETARRNYADSAKGLKNARASWKKTLSQLGLAASLSPKSIRVLAEGYESLTTTRRRLKALEDELGQRKIELSTGLQRIEALSLQLKVAIEESRDGGETTKKVSMLDRQSESTREARPSDPRRQDDRRDRDRRDQRNRDEQLSLRAASAAASGEVLDGPLVKLQELTNTLAQHKQYIVERKQLKSQDEELAKKQKGFQRSMDKWVRARQAHLADLGVENQSQLEELMSLKQQFLALEAEENELSQRIKSIVGGIVPYDTVVRLLESTTGSELEKRWDTLGQRIQQAEERIAVLLQRQGETSQEMKTLASDRRLAEAKLELASLEKQIASCADHWRTLGATSAMLEKVCEVYETERQPETLREASAFLKQLTDGKYVRVWTPLGKNALRIDNDKNQSLPLEVLSRGTREAVFIALRLSLAAAYSRRGVTLPLVLDDVLVNFDTIRAKSAAKVLQDFAALGHQVVMFTCHEHIMRMFHDIHVQVRVLPAHGQSGEARIYQPHDVPVSHYVEAPKVVVVPLEPVVVPEPQSEPVMEIELEPMAEEPEWVAEYSFVEPEAAEHDLAEESDADQSFEKQGESVATPPTVEVKQPVRKKPRQQVPVPVVVEQEFVEPVEREPFSLWYEEDLGTNSDSQEPAERLWNELDRIELPIEYEPHDLWWSQSRE